MKREAGKEASTFTWWSTALDAFRDQRPGASPAPARRCSTVVIHGRNIDGCYLASGGRRGEGGSRAAGGRFVAKRGQVRAPGLRTAPV